jgi:hypothetical protein
MVKHLDDSQFYVSQLEQLLFGKYTKKIPIRLFMDLKPMLESISSTHQVEEKLLRNSITDMREILTEGQVQSFSWLDGERDMVADALTKCKKNDDLESVVLHNKFRFQFCEDNLVDRNDGEIKMKNRRNKKTSTE